MADFPLFDGGILEAIGYDATDSKGTTLTSSASSHTKGAWSELAATASEGITGFYVVIYNTQEASGSSRIYVDIGIGASGFEVVLVPDLRCLSRVQTTNNCYYIPIAIPGGARVSARMQSGTSGSITCDVALIAVRGGFLASSPLSNATHYGLAAASTSATEIDPGATTNTKGAASEITASCTNSIKSMILCITNSTATYPFSRSYNTGYLLDIGIGATPDYIITNLPLICNAMEDCITPKVIGPFDCSIPAGTRIVARAQSNDNTADHRTFDLSILGFN